MGEAVCSEPRLVSACSLGVQPRIKQATNKSVQRDILQTTARLPLGCSATWLIGLTLSVDWGCNVERPRTNALNKKRTKQQAIPEVQRSYSCFHFGVTGTLVTTSTSDGSGLLPLAYQTKQSPSSMIARVTIATSETLCHHAPHKQQKPEIDSNHTARDFRRELYQRDT